MPSYIFSPVVLEELKDKMREAQNHSDTLAGLRFLQEFYLLIELILSSTFSHVYLETFYTHVYI